MTTKGALEYREPQEGLRGLLRHGARRHVLHSCLQDVRRRLEPSGFGHIEDALTTDGQKMRAARRELSAGRRAHSGGCFLCLAAKHSQ